MFAVKRVIGLVRLKVGDLAEINYSDWEIIQSINEGLRLLGDEFAMRNCDFLESETEYTAVEVVKGALLPDDFFAIRKVIAGHYVLSPSTGGCMDSGEYTISGNKLYATTGVRLLYRRQLPAVNAGDNIDLPAAYLDPIAKFTGMILTNAAQDALLEYAKDIAIRLIPRRRYSNVKIDMPFRVVSETNE